MLHSIRTVCAAVAAAAAVCAAPAAAQDAMPTPEEMWETIQRQQRLIEELTGQVRRNEARIEDTTGRVAETEVMVEATGDLVESTLAEDGGAGDGWWANTQLGGYGEVHYNRREDNKSQIDVHRLVLFLGHDFSDTVRLAGELEVEHALAGEGKPGEVEVEQAFIEYDYTPGHSARAGVFLIPVGLLNETHEPPTYYGVERNIVEKNIIPTTWWEAGLGLAGELGAGLSYDVSVHSGLGNDKMRGTDEKAGTWKIRDGRQKVAEAEANAAAFTGRLRYTGMPGVEVAATGQYQGDLTQGKGVGGMGGEEVSATLIEGHVAIRRGVFGLRALAARWNLDGAAPDASGRDVQWGWYVEPAVRFDAGGFDIGLFTRYSMSDNNAGSDENTALKHFDVGANIWLHEDVVLKIDHTLVKQSGADDENILNLGVGFQF